MVIEPDVIVPREFSALGLSVLEQPARARAATAVPAMIFVRRDIMLILSESFSDHIFHTLNVSMM
jgi:hypothetical protein